MLFKMVGFKVLLITSLITIITAMGPKPTDMSFFQQARDKIISAEESLVTGGNLNLTNREIEVEEIFMTYKRKELLEGFQYSDKHPAGMHFFKAKRLIDRSLVFEILQKMPKGALLHTDSLAAVSSEWVVRKIFYMNGLMRCETKNLLTIFTFRRKPKLHGCNTQYVYINDERNNASSPRFFDNSLEKFINLRTSIPELEYDSTNTVYTLLDNMFLTLSDALYYIEAFRIYYTQMLQELYNDNIMYAEVRMELKPLYDRLGNSFHIEQTVDELIEIVDEFKKRNPDFLGIKIIYAAHRKSQPDVIIEHFKIFEKLRSIFPEYVIGFDLFGQEDKGKSLFMFKEILTEKQNSTNFFFSAGETNLYGAIPDRNLISAMLLKTKRIGHGYALMKHPLLLTAVRAEKIAVEVCPISNQVLHLVSDLRNHPATFLISQNIPMVIGNDSPGFWNAKALSYDFYYTIMSLAPNYAGLKVLKQLVWNSITYSMLSDSEKNRAYEMLKQKWKYFLDDVILKYNE